MRQGQQQNRRGRGRNRKGQSPLTRSFESNGPDVKIRGTPAHIAEKYMALARDSMSSGDPVLAENYLQHAEHYNRIIMAFREQQAPNANDVVNGNNRFRSPVPEQYENDDAGEEDGEENVADANQQAVVQPNDPQPTIPTRSERPERGERSERTGDQRPQRDRRNGSNGPRQRSDRSDREPRRRERQRFGESGDQPDFLRRPVRRTRREDTADDAETAAAATPAETATAVEESQE